MNFGIPFKRPWGIPFGVPFIGSGTGGGIPFPSSGNVGYYTPFDITKLGFSSANNVNLVVDQSTASNNLTQGTASANMVFNEHDTVTQFTSANQPTLVDTGGGELAMEFTNVSALNNYPSSTDFCIKVAVNIGLNPSANQRLIGQSNAYRGIFIRQQKQTIRIQSDNDALFDFNTVLIPSTDYEIEVKKDNNSLSVYVDGTLSETKDCTGETFTYDQIGISSVSQSLAGGLYFLRQWNSADSSGTPDFELLPTVDSCNVLAGQQVSRWNSTTHRAFKNRLLSDGSNDNYDGLPTQAGDFSYVFKCEFDIIAQTEYLLSDTGDSAWLLLADGLLYLRDTTGSNDIALTGHTIEAGDHVYIISREGDDLKYYVDSNLIGTFDVTGRTFTFSRVGATADSIKTLNAEWGVWNRAFTQDDVDYFSYLRDDDTNAILQPPLTPAP